MLQFSIKNKEIVDDVLSMWPGLRMVNGKPRHSQSQGSVERANRDIENLLACWQAENNSTNWSKALNIIQFQKNKKCHSGINREPYMAMFGRKPEFGLKDLNLPDEVLDALETEEQLAEALGLEALSGTNSTELVEVETDQNVEFVTVIEERWWTRICKMWLCKNLPSKQYYKYFLTYLLIVEQIPLIQTYRFSDTFNTNI
jgi:hypothetical protein